MDWSVMLEARQLVPGLVVGALALGLMAIPFGLDRKTVAAAVLLVLCVNGLYPEGSLGLLADAFGPMRGLIMDTEERRDAHTAEIDDASGTSATAGKR
jgi:hypothetical protein